MSTEVVNQENQQFRSKNVKFETPIKLKGIDEQVFVDGEILQFDPADGTYIAFAGAVLADLARAILSLGVGESIVLDVADTLEPAATICIGGEVIEDALTYPAGITIDTVPPNAVLSVREQLREVGIIARSADTINESNLA